MLRPGLTTSFQPATTLRSRSYVGLIISQFLAAFNDQAIHIVAIFYAGDMLLGFANIHATHRFFGENTIIALVTACFIVPFALFSTLAGMLADKYSKRNILVFWKVAEVGITGMVLVGFLLPHAKALNAVDPKTLAVWSAALVVSGVFLMGTHSTFFIPAKYGVMPEILEHNVLSRGNGYLEATSFLATIIGTVAGAGLYSLLKSHVEEGELVLGSEWLLGVVLVGLAVLGAAFSLLIERMPAAAPDQPLTWKLWQPLGHNVGVMLRSRPLALAVVGIAFFACLTLYARQTLLYQGEALKDLRKAQQAVQAEQAQQEARRALEEREREEADGENPEAPLIDLHPNATRRQNAELRVAFLIALVGLGIGIGSPLAGVLSGDKVELGLVPIGTFFLIVFTVLLAFVNQRLVGQVTSLILIGVAAGFYIVPLYTLLQHRAPKDSKGNLVATSNFINVVGGLLAIGVFWLLTAVLEKWRGINLDAVRAVADPAMQAEYVRQLQRKVELSTVLFLAASVMTAGMLLLLCQQLPDFFTRTLLWLRSLSRYRLQVVGLNNLPSDGPVILATNCDRPESCMQVLAATDRFTRFILIEPSEEHRLPPVLRYLANRTHLAVLRPGEISEEVLNRTLADAVRVLERGEMVGLPANGHAAHFDVDRFLGRLRARIAAQILPVWCGCEKPEAPKESGRPHVRVVLGRPLPPTTPADALRESLHRLADEAPVGAH